jgi:hypothetical protein
LTALIAALTIGELLTPKTGGPYGSAIIGCRYAAGFHADISSIVIGAAMKLEDLLQATAGGTLPDFLAGHSAELTPKIAEQARETMRGALAAGNLGLAEVAAAAAAQAWLTLGNHQQAIKNLIDLQQMAYMRAEAPAQYAEARTRLLDSVAKAQQIGAHAEAFKAATIAADCSYWAADGSGGEQRDEEILQTLGDVIAAGQMITDDLTLAQLQGDGERFVSLAAAAANMAMSNYFGTGPRAPQADQLLGRLAATVDRAIPADFSYDQFDAPGKTGQTAQVFTSLSDTYGE